MEEIMKTKTKEFSTSEGIVEYTCRYLGTITLSDHIHASDPCYDRYVWCRREIEDVLPGEYRVYSIHNDKEHRVHSLVLLHEKKHKPWQFIFKWAFGKDVGVDSGQFGFFDDSIYPLTEKTGGEMEDLDSFYGKCCQATLSKEQEGIIDNKGVVSSSGWGDGAYPYYVNALGKKSAFMVDYLSENDQEMLTILFGLSDKRVEKTKKGEEATS